MVGTEYKWQPLFHGKVSAQVFVNFTVRKPKNKDNFSNRRVILEFHRIRHIICGIEFIMSKGEEMGRNVDDRNKLREIIVNTMVRLKAVFHSRKFSIEQNIFDLKHAH